jgi:hypothetical protein
VSSSELVLIPDANAYRNFAGMGWVFPLFLITANSLQVQGTRPHHTLEFSADRKEFSIRAVHVLGSRSACAPPPILLDVEVGSGCSRSGMFITTSVGSACAQVPCVFEERQEES